MQNKKDNNKKGSVDFTMNRSTFIILTIFVIFGVLNYLGVIKIGY